MKPAKKERRKAKRKERAERVRLSDSATATEVRIPGARHREARPEGFRTR